MANPMIEYNTLFFNNVLEQIHDISHPAHCIKFDDPDSDKTFFLGLKLKSVIPVLFSSKAIEINIVIDAETTRYIIVTNSDFEEIEFDTDHIAVHGENRASILLFLGAKKILNPYQDKLKDFHENLLYEDTSNNFEYMVRTNGERVESNGNNIRLHYLQELEEYYDKFTVFKINSTGDLREATCRQIICFLIATQTKQRWLPFSQDTLIAYQNFTLTGSHYVPYELILESLLANNWKYAYKDLYRCIEGLYTFPQVSSFREDISFTTIPLRKLAASIENRLGWRPNEAEAFGLLLHAVQDSLLDKFLSLFSTDDDIKSWDADLTQIEKLNEVNPPNERTIEKYKIIVHEKKAKYVAKKLYALRNSLVHFRPALDVIQKDDNEWNRILMLMIELVERLYDFYGQDFYVDIENLESAS